MVKVRAATVADCPDIYSIQVAAIRSLPGGSEGRDGIEKWLNDQEPSVYAAQMDQDLFVVAEEHDIVGWGSLSVTKQEIRNVFVHPEFHRRRVGSAILDGLEARAREAGLNEVQLQATGTAIVFYLANGYQSDPPVEPGADWALMKKPLGS